MADEGEFPKIDGDVLYGSEVNNFIRNEDLSGITPTNTGGWATVPTDLANIVDGDITTSTNTFQVSNGGGGGYINIDLGYSKVRPFVMVKYEIVADASSSGVIVEVSNDNSNWGTVTSLSESGNGVYSLGGFVLESGYSAIRYVRIKFDDGTGQTGKVYLVQVY